MSELIDNAGKKKEILKHMILELHKGEAPEAVREQLARVMGEVPYDMVVEAEQELIADGLPVTEVLAMCDIHSAALKGHISQKSAKEAPAGHPVHTFKEENRALRDEIAALHRLFNQVKIRTEETNLKGLIEGMRYRFNALSDVEKHYRRKENLLFPFMEQHGINGPPRVMWGKHDETRDLLKSAIESLQCLSGDDPEELAVVIELVLSPAAASIEEMIFKEDEILFPMCLDTLSDDEWSQIYNQSPEVGFCLIDPKAEWSPAGEAAKPQTKVDSEKVRFPTGSLTVEELTAILNTVPFDLTFVDAEDTVKFFTAGRERIFERNRAVIGRKVQLCHPPSSAWIVQKILDDFRTGGEDRAPFWINMGGKLVHIEYFAVRNGEGKYMGTLEVTQDLTEKKKIEGEQRLLTYVKDWKS